MKKTILSLLLLANLYADNSQIYLGLSGGYYNESFTDGVDAKSSSYTSKLKVGYGDRDAYAVEFSLDYMDNKSNIFSSSDGSKTGMNVELLKAFDFDTFINPFFKAGFGAGFFSIDTKLQQTLHYGSYNLGAGFFIPLNKSFDFEVSYDYKAITYEGLDTIANSVSYKSNLNAISFGFNVRY